ncbi:unnamed protein product [Phytomonas sp. Hart1]|nr:unnamed protein product [Phytomonas sp. Hart1]|eukprot:CCW70766.1 unnamed protein product [Phytomonas sp. isolate Hart1]
MRKTAKTTTAGMMKLDRREVINRDLVLGDAIGAGAYGRVFMAEPIHSSKHPQSDYPPRFVVKIINRGLCTPDFIECANRELKAVSGLCHPCVVKYIDVWVETGPGSYQGSYCIAMNYCDGGDLHNYIRTCIKRKQYPSSEVVVRVMACVLSALSYCHARSVIHRDIKPANIFLVRGERGAIDQVLIGDFGLARPLADDTQMVATRVGTPCYCSPEIVSAELYTGKTDIFSAGVTFYELMKLERPFWKSQYKDFDVFERILRWDPIPYLSAHSLGRFSTNLVRLVARCLSKYELKRPSAYFLLIHVSEVHEEALRMHLPIYSTQGILYTKAGEGADREPSRECGEVRRNSAVRHRGCTHETSPKAAVAVPPGAVAGLESAPEPRYPFDKGDIV